MKKTSLIKENAKLQELLNPINEEYYGNLLIYVRSNSVFKDEKILEEALLEILQDILDAQENGETAEDYFVKQPKEIADALLKEVPISIGNGVHLAVAVLFVYALITVIPSLASPNTLLDVGKLLIGSIYWTILAIIIVWQIGNNIYTTKRTFKKYLAIFLTIMFIILGISLSIFFKTSLTLDTEGLVGISIIAVILLSCGIFFLRQTHKKELTPFVPIMLTTAIIGVLYRIPVSQEFLTSNLGKGLVATCMLLSLISFYVLLHRGVKK